jgi:hypothetical protein
MVGCRDVKPSPQGRHKLHLVEVLMDSVFALVIVMLAVSIPLPSDVGWPGDSLFDFLSNQSSEILFSAVGWSGASDSQA